MPLLRAGNHTFNGSASDDVIYADAGNDSIFGGAGNDQFYGQAGNEMILGDSGNDWIDGGEGVDTGNYRLRSMPALCQRSTGDVVFVSADRLIDESSRIPYFAVRLRMLELPDNLSTDQIYPGMPVEAFICTGSGTFLEYLIQPVTDSFARAFREE